MWSCALISWSSALGIKGEKKRYTSTSKMPAGSPELKKMCSCETRIVHTTVNLHRFIVSYRSIDPHRFTLGYRFTLSWQSTNYSFWAIPGSCMSNLFLRTYKKRKLHNFFRKIQIKYFLFEWTPLCSLNPLFQVLFMEMEIRPTFFSFIKCLQMQGLFSSSSLSYPFFQSSLIGLFLQGHSWSSLESH